MKLLVIGYVWPEPRSSAAGAHLMQLIELFQQQDWQLTFASPSLKTEHSTDLSTLGIVEQSISLNCSSFDLWVKGLNPDIVLFDRFMMEEQFGWRVSEQCPQALRVLETSDLHCLRDIRQHLFKKNPDVIPALSPAELYAAMAMQDITQRELASVYRCDISLIISEFEMHLLRHHFRVPEQLLCYCPFMLGEPSPHRWRSFQDRKDFISLGNFLHAPNWDSVLWLKQKIWPLIRAQLPEAHLLVYGAYTPPKARELHQPTQGFHVMGRAEQADQVMSEARVCLAPLRFGAGLKGKLIDALWNGTPSVTTSIGAEAMTHPDSGDWCGAVVDEPLVFAAAAVQLYQDPTSWQTAQQKGLAILQSRFDKANMGPQLIRQWMDCHYHLPQHRLHNFTGLMLQHHQHKSTHYMARWIEAKNINTENINTENKTAEKSEKL